jgi:hypothetical protein
MSRIVTLSNNSQVFLKDRFTHGAESVYTAAREEGVMERQVVEDGKLKTYRDTPVTNFGQAIEATLLYMIEKVKDGETETSATKAWLDELDEPDYEKLAEALVDIRRTTRERIEGGKKSS